MNKFVEFTSGRLVHQPVRPPGRSWTTTTATPSPALWNYAQHFAMSDNSFSTNFGPSTAGALNLVSGQTHGVSTRPRRRRGAGQHVATDATAWDRHRRPATRPRRLRRLQPRRPATWRHARQEHRRPAERQGRHLGLVPGRLQAEHAGDGEHRRSAAPRTRNVAGAASATTPAPRAVPVLRLDGQPAPPAAELAGRDRPRPTRRTTSTT